MKSNTSGRVRSIFVHLVLIFLSFLCSVFLLHSDCKCNTFPCGSAVKDFQHFPENIFLRI